MINFEKFEKNTCIRLSLYGILGDGKFGILGDGKFTSSLPQEVLFVYRSSIPISLT